MSHHIRFVVPLLLGGAVIAGAQARTPVSPGSQAGSPVATAALDAPGATWKSRKTKHAVVYALAGTAAERRLASDADRAERAIVANLAWLGASGGSPLRLFLVGSREDMRRFTGNASGGWSVTAEGTAFFVANDSVRPALRHETMHLLSWRHWGTPGGMWLSEGLATLAVGDCQGQTIEQAVAAARTAGMFAPLDTLRSAFVTAGEIGVAHYMESASLVRYIDRTYGRKKLRAFWSTGGLGGAVVSLGITPEALEERWRESLRKTSPKSSWATLWNRIKARGCE
jgi:hypothetical protein